MRWQCGASSRRTFFDREWLAFTGLSRETAADDGWTTAIHPLDRPSALALYGRHVEAASPFEIQYRLRHADGSYRLGIDRGTPFVDASGEVAGFAGTFTEVHQTTPEGPSRLEEFFDLSLDNLCVAGLDGYFKRLNPSWTRTLGWSLAELMARPSAEFVHPEDRASTLAARERLGEGTPLNGLVNRYLAKDGTYRWFEWQSVAQVDRGLVYAAARDVTEQREVAARREEDRAKREALQRELILSDRLASVGTLAGGVAHEINNPLASVTANVGVLLDELARADATSSPAKLTELREIALEARDGADRIRAIVGGLRTFSRAGVERTSLVDPNVALRIALDLTASELRSIARVKVAFGETPLVEVDEARIGQVFVNLLLHAAREGREADAASRELHVFTSTGEDGRAHVEFRDPRLHPAASSMFELFDPSDAVGKGFGLGLFISDAIVTAAGGSLSVTSDADLGTVFRVVLPPAVRKVEAPSEARPTTRSLSARATILVVDDEPAIGQVLRRILRAHDVTLVTRARAALDLLDCGRQFDLIFSDLMMPEMSGMAFYEALVARFPEAAERVVFVSGGAFTEEAHVFLERVPNARLEKPFDPAAVHDLVGRVVSADKGPSS